MSQGSCAFQGGFMFDVTCLTDRQDQIEDPAPRSNRVSNAKAGRMCVCVCLSTSAARFSGCLERCRNN